MQPAPDIFKFIDYREFLQAWLNHRKSVEPGYSFRIFAQAAGLARGTLPNVLSRARSNPRPETLDAFAQAMSLSPSERNYLGKLVELDGIDSLSHRREFLADMVGARAFRQSEKMEDRPSAFERLASRWYYGAIRELAGHPGFRADPAWIASVLVPAISVDEAREALKTLVELGVLVEEQGRLTLPTLRVQTEDETSAQASHQFHSEIVPFVARNFNATPKDERHLVGGAMLLPEAVLPEVKLLLHQVAERIGTMADDPRGGDRRVYHLAIQFVPLTRSVS